MKNLRWICALPVSILALVTSNLIWMLFYKSIIAYYIDSHFWMKLLFSDIMSFTIAGMAFVYAGTYIAPNQKKETGLVLLALLTLIFVVSLFFTPSLVSTVDFIASITGAIFGYLSVVKYQKKKESTHFNFE